MDSCRESIDLVEDQELFLAAEFQLVQNTPDRFYFAINVFGACVHDMNQQTRVTELLKSSVKSCDQIGGQISVSGTGAQAPET